MEYYDLKKNDTLCIIGGAKAASSNDGLGEKIPYGDMDKDYLHVGYCLWGQIMGLKNQLDSLSVDDRDEKAAEVLCILADIYTNVQIIDIHTLYTRNVQYIEWLKNDGTQYGATEVPKLMQDTYPEIPNSIRFPLTEIREAFNNTNFFISSFDYMIAYAIYMGYKRIELYRVSFMHDDECQRDSLYYWLGLARGKGLEVIVTPESSLLRINAMYGYEADNTLAVYIQKHIQGLKSTIIESINEVQRHNLKLVNAIKTLYVEEPKFMNEIRHRHGLSKNGLVSEGDMKRKEGLSI